MCAGWQYAAVTDPASPRGPAPRHSIADPLGGGRLSAPSAARNTQPIIEAMRPWIPATGLALEIASGTGEHVLAFARAFPGLDWQPSDVEADRIVSIDAWRAAEGGANLRPARRLDATGADWGVQGCALVSVTNLFHLICAAAAQAVLAGARRALAPGGRFFIYGPFRTGAAFRSEGDRRFHRALTAQDPQIGYKDIEWLEARARAAGLRPLALVEMPASNLMLILERPVAA